MASNTKKQFLCIANWKTYLLPSQEQALYKAYCEDLIQAAQQANTTIITCPSFLSLTQCTSSVLHKSFSVGAQDCSAYSIGAYTGHITATALKEIGCSHVIIGHSERRLYNHETDAVIAQKTLCALEQQMVPIVCIGETADQRDKQQTLNVLQAQLEQILTTYQPFSISQQLIIAYEPVWSIGTGLIPTLNDLETLFSWLYTVCRTSLPHTSWKLLYGGSVSSRNASSLKTIGQIDGFLIGKASLDIKEMLLILNA